MTLLHRNIHSKLQNFHQKYMYRYLFKNKLAFKKYLAQNM